MLAKENFSSDDMMNLSEDAYENGYMLGADCKNVEIQNQLRDVIKTIQREIPITPEVEACIQLIQDRFML